MRFPVMLALALALSSGLAEATERNASSRYKFKHSNPCPSTGRSSGACPGYQVDHRQPLAAGGADHKSNMQWLRG